MWRSNTVHQYSIREKLLFSFLLSGCLQYIYILAFLSFFPIFFLVLLLGSDYFLNFVIFLLCFFALLCALISCCLFVGLISFLFFYLIWPISSSVNPGFISISPSHPSNTLYTPVVIWGEGGEEERGENNRNKMNSWDTSMSL